MHRRAALTPSRQEAKQGIESHGARTARYGKRTDTNTLKRNGEDLCITRMGHDWVGTL